MKIVVGVTDHPLPVTDGMHLHVHNVLAELRDRHEITLVSQPGPGHDTSPAALDAICSSFRPAPAPPAPGGALERVRTELSTITSGRSKVLDRTIRSGLPDAVRAAVAEVRPDVVHLETGALAVVAEALGAPTVVVPLDADDLNAAAYTRYAGGPLKRWLQAREARRWSRFERSSYHRCDALVVVGERDAEALHAVDARLSPHVVPNGVDTEHFAPGTAPRLEDVVVLHGAMDYPPNVDAAIYAATEVLPLLQRRRPGARLVLVGRNPEPRVLALAGPDVEVTGAVDDLRPHLQTAGAYLCPMRLGSGIKNKLLEAFATGCPSVATPLATNGVGTTPDHDVLVADDAEGLADALARILDDPAGLGARLGAAARVRAEAMSWAAAARAFEAIYAEAVERHAARTSSPSAR